MFKRAIRTLNTEFMQEQDFLDQDLDDATITYEEYYKWCMRLRHNYRILYKEIMILREIQHAKHKRKK